MDEEKTLLSAILDDKGYVIQFCTNGILKNETCHFYTDIPEDFFELYQAYRVEQKDDLYFLTLDTKAIPDVEAANELNELRALRETECFSYVNRGKLWYDRLTKEQLVELDEWYEAWLNVTENTRKGSLNIPTRPKWLV